jgi:hypothetical protein
MATCTTETCSCYWICYNMSLCRGPASLLLRTKQTFDSSPCPSLLLPIDIKYVFLSFCVLVFFVAISSRSLLTNKHLRLYFCLLLPLWHTQFLLYFWTSYRVIDIFIHTALHSHRLQSPNASVHCLRLKTRTYVLCISTVTLFLYCQIRLKFISGLRPQNPCHFSWQFLA